MTGARSCGAPRVKPAPRIGGTLRARTGANKRILWTATFTPTSPSSRRARTAEKPICATCRDDRRYLPELPPRARKSTQPPARDRPLHGQVPPRAEAPRRRPRRTAARNRRDAARRSGRIAARWSRWAIRSGRSRCSRCFDRKRSRCLKRQRSASARIQRRIRRLLGIARSSPASFPCCGWSSSFVLAADAADLFGRQRVLRHQSLARRRRSHSGHQ